ncbi:hypothetical protein NB646_06370 [Oxalobacter aliiformigenes]|uniref:Uncharacterized protein n=1 Tax=Oxalobacter aliiformigenes TaxID=2946593 RepID=A0A9E9NSJ6_9BURK|nr:hypothetical protein [Oxalobacter aliiformigenes]WAV90495.1 hypothetical protein NB646_06370 [Oxalobacter aliiformigenes]
MKFTLRLPGGERSGNSAGTAQQRRPGCSFFAKTLQCILSSGTRRMNWENTFSAYSAIHYSCANSPANGILIGPSTRFMLEPDSQTGLSVAVRCMATGSPVSDGGAVSDGEKARTDEYHYRGDLENN